MIVWSIVKNYGNFFRYTVLYAMCSTSIFPCIITIITELMTFLSLTYSSSNCSLQIKQIFVFLYDSRCSFVNNFYLFFFFLKLIISIAYSVKDSQNVFMQSLQFYNFCDLNVYIILTFFVSK